MGAQTNNQDENSDVGNSSVNDNEGGRDHLGMQHTWRKRVDLPTFEGLEPHSWINRAERFFEIQKLTEEDKVELAYVSMEGSVSYWFKAWKEKANNRSWTGLKTALISRFGGGFRGKVF